MIERVRKEVEIHSRLKHPAILEVRCSTPSHWTHEGHLTMHACRVRHTPVASLGKTVYWSMGNSPANMDMIMSRDPVCGHATLNEFLVISKS